MGIWLTRYLPIIGCYCNSPHGDLNSGGLVDWVKCPRMLLFMPDLLLMVKIMECMVVTSIKHPNFCYHSDIIH